MQTETWKQLTLRTRTGEGQLTSMANVAEATHLACALHCVPAARGRLRKLNPQATEAEIMQAIDTLAVQSTQSRLKDIGVIPANPEPGDHKGAALAVGDCRPDLGLQAICGHAEQHDGGQMPTGMQTHSCRRKTTGTGWTPTLGQARVHCAP